jgi:hypothetical protein
MRQRSLQKLPVGISLLNSVWSQADCSSLPPRASGFRFGSIADILMFTASAMSWDPAPGATSPMIRPPVRSSAMTAYAIRAHSRSGAKSRRGSSVLASAKRWSRVDARNLDGCDRDPARICDGRVQQIAMLPTCCRNSAGPDRQRTEERWRPRCLTVRATPSQRVHSMGRSV